MNGKSFLNHRSLTQIILVLIAAFVGGPHVHAQAPLPEKPPTAKDPVTKPSTRAVLNEEAPRTGFPELVEPTAEPLAAERIEEALQGGSNHVPGGVLGGVIEIIRKQGSVLDGSSLDRRSAAGQREGLPPAEMPSTQTGGSPVQTAEILLRAARRLELLGPHVARQHGTHPDLVPIPDLVRQLRVQATRLLATEFPQAIQ